MLVTSIFADEEVFNERLIKLKPITQEVHKKEILNFPAEFINHTYAKEASPNYQLKFIIQKINTKMCRKLV